MLISNIKIALRANITKILLVLGILILFSAWLASGLSGRQPTTVLLDFGFSGARIILCMMLLAWLQELFAKPIEKKYISQALAQPLPRYRYLLGTYFSISILLLFTVTVFALLLILAASFGTSYEQVWPVNLGWQYILTWLYMYISLLIVLAFGFVIACLSTTAYLSIFIGFCFYIIGHTIGPVISYLSLVETADGTQRNTILPLLNIVKFIIPDLNMLDVRQWALYNENVSVLLAVKMLTQAVLYIAVSLWLAIALFNRREFS